MGLLPLGKEVSRAVIPGPLRIGPRGLGGSRSLKL